jgi:threonine aldolase
MLGGGMRQAGVLAAAGLISLEKMTKRLGEDHARAKKMYQELKQVSGLILEAQPQTNMVYFGIANHISLTDNQIIDEVKKYGVIIDWDSPRRFRLVTHYWIDDLAVEKSLHAIAKVLG